MHIKKMSTGLVCGIFLSMLTACASVGSNFDSTQVSSIEIGVTTKSTIEQTYGKPWRTGIEDGKATWTYGYYRYRLFGNSSTKDLVVRFNKNDTVASYSFNQTLDQQ